MISGKKREEERGNLSEVSPKTFTAGQYLSGKLLCPAGRILAFDQTFILDRRAHQVSDGARIEEQP